MNFIPIDCHEYPRIISFDIDLDKNELMELTSLLNSGLAVSISYAGDGSFDECGNLHESRVGNSKYMVVYERFDRSKMYGCYHREHEEPNWFTEDCIFFCKIYPDGWEKFIGLFRRKYKLEIHIDWDGSMMLNKTMIKIKNEN